MSALETLKKAGNSLVAALNWVGANLTALLTFSVVVLGFLYSRKKDEAESLKTDIELKTEVMKIAEDTKEVDSAKEKSKDSVDAYLNAKRDYDASKR